MSFLVFLCLFPFAIFAAGFFFGSLFTRSDLNK
jgi:hypothetical protein